MLSKIRSKFRWHFKRREVEAEWRGFIAGMQYGEYLTKKETSK